VSTLQSVVNELLAAGCVAPHPQYLTILADPPWEQHMAGRCRGRHSRPRQLPYLTMSPDQIKSLQVASVAAERCHLWLWTTFFFSGKRSFTTVQFPEGPRVSL
jgi:N6-adenosine-specific RNA methylase IME4